MNQNRLIVKKAAMNVPSLNIKSYSQLACGHEANTASNAPKYRGHTLILMRQAKRGQLLETEVKVVFSYDFCREIISRSKEAFAVQFIGFFSNSLEEIILYET